MTNATEIFIGTSPAGVEWIARANRRRTAEQAAEIMRPRLAALWARRREVSTVRVRRLSASVVFLAEEMLSARAENGEDVSRVRIGASYVEAPRVWLADLAAAVRDRADEIESGTYGLAETANYDLPHEFCVAADARRARSMRRHANRLERA